MRNGGTERLQNLLKVLTSKSGEFRLAPQVCPKAQTLNHEPVLCNILQALSQMPKVQNLMRSQKTTQHHSVKTSSSTQGSSHLRLPTSAQWAGRRSSSLVLRQSTVLPLLHYNWHASGLNAFNTHDLLRTLMECFFLPRAPPHARIKQWTREESCTKSHNSMVKHHYSSHPVSSLGGHSFEATTQMSCPCWFFSYVVKRLRKRATVDQPLESSC